MKRRRASALAIAVVLVAGAARGADELDFRGAPKTGWSRAELAKLVPAQQVRVWDPYELREIELEAFPMNAVLDATFGARWRERDEILMTCKDGFQPSVPVQRFLKHRAWLAFRRIDQRDFELLEHDVTPPVRVNLSPYYLVWANLDDPQVRAEGDLGWPYQLVAVEPVDFQAHFPKLAPPAGAGEPVRQGFLAFRSYCLPCHTVNGEGGRVGPELNYPMNVTEYWHAPALRRWILDPRSVRSRAAMPSIAPGLADREGMVDTVITYLEAMATKKVAP